MTYDAIRALDYPSKQLSSILKNQLYFHSIQVMEPA